MSEEDWQPLAAELPAALTERYAPEGFLGRGAMGLVLRARDTRLRRPVALKVIRPLDGEPLEAARFLSELRALAALSHPNVVKLFDSGETSGLSWLVMELLEGQPLANRMMAGRMPPSAVARWLDGTLDGLTHLHAAQLLHRDIKPGNIFLKGDQAVLMDLGLALSLDGRTRVTAAGELVGTLYYMAPEVLRQQQWTVAADEFAVAVTAVHALAGEGVHDRVTPSMDAVLSHTLSGAYVAVAQALMADFGALGRVLCKALALSPGQRFGSAAAFRQAVAEAVAPRRSRPVRVAPVVSAPRRAPGWIGAALCGAVALSGTVWYLNGPKAPPREHPVITETAPPSASAAPLDLVAQAAAFDHRLLSATPADREKLTDEFLDAVARTPVPERRVPLSHQAIVNVAGRYFNQAGVFVARIERACSGYSTWERTYLLEHPEKLQLHNDLRRVYVEERARMPMGVNLPELRELARHTFRCTRRLGHALARLDLGPGTEAALLVQVSGVHLRLLVAGTHTWSTINAGAESWRTLCEGSWPAEYARALDARQQGDSARRAQHLARAAQALDRVYAPPSPLAAEDEVSARLALADELCPLARLSGAPAEAARALLGPLGTRLANHGPLSAGLAARLAAAVPCFPARTVLNR